MLSFSEKSAAVIVDLGESKDAVKVLAPESAASLPRVNASSNVRAGRMRCSMPAASRS